MLKFTIPQVIPSNLFLPVCSSIYLNIKPATNDVVVKSDGTVNYVIAMYTTVLCRINLLTYPFSEGSCPVAINGWNQSCKICKIAIHTEWSDIMAAVQSIKSCRVQLMFTSYIRLGKKCMWSERLWPVTMVWLLVADRLVWVCQKLLGFIKSTA